MGARSRRGSKKRSNTPIIIVVLVVMVAVVGYYIFTQSGAGAGAGPQSALVGTPVDPAILSQISGVPDATLNAINGLGVKTAGISPIITNTPLTLNGKPEVLYVGAEYCPFCGVERWSMIMALDRFGNFSGLEYMQSAGGAETAPLTSTFTFVNATYTSSYISFVSVEQYDRSHNPLQTVTPDETALMSQYDKGQSIPFIDFGNSYVLVGSQAQPTVLRIGDSLTGAPYNWTAIASGLDNPQNIFAQNVDEATNHFISAICKIDGSKPMSVCTQNYALVVSFHPGQPDSQPQLSDIVYTGAPSRRTL